jgi:hypothetical protein
VPKLCIAAATTEQRWFCLAGWLVDRVQLIP